MPRNLDLTALRSFVTVADCAGVTRAAGQLNLTQSAVSMQLKRLEEALDQKLLDRSQRQIALNPAGEQLLSYARRILSLNDEAFTRLTAEEFECEIVLGVPHDIVLGYIPRMLQQFAAEFPRVRVHLVSSFTRVLKEDFAKGECDMIVTTEDGVDEGGETLRELPLVWVGAPGGCAWRRRPLPLAFEDKCFFKPVVHRALDEAGIPWAMQVSSNSSRTVEATVSADLAIHAMLEGMQPTTTEAICHGGALPELRSFRINLYGAGNVKNPAEEALADLLRRSYADKLPLRRGMAPVPVGDEGVIGEAVSAAVARQQPSRSTAAS